MEYCGGVLGALLTPLLVLCVILALGYLLGAITIKGVSLGSAGVLLVAIIGCTPFAKKLFLKLTKYNLYWLRPVLAFLVLVVCIAYLVDSTYNPFLYFRF